MAKWPWILGAGAAGLVGAQLPGEAGLVLAVLLATMVLWIGEVMPLAATGLLSSLLLILVGQDTSDVFTAYFDPVVVLLLGGFFLGVALSKHGLDVALADMVLARTGGSPRWTLLAIMLLTAVFSMWISNTASTAIMLPLALGLVVGHPDEKGMAKGLVLGVAFSANVGGIATPIGTSPNPIALRFLRDAGHEVSFLEWMVRMTPLAFAMVFVLWGILLWLYPISGHARIKRRPRAGFSRDAWKVVALFAVTVGFWLTEHLHGLSPSVVSVGAVVGLFALGVLQENDIGAAGWPTLLLIGSSLALGDAVLATGLDGHMGRGLAALVDGQGWLAFLVVGVGALVLTIMGSNTAAAVIMVPIAMSLAAAWQAPVVPLTLMATAVLSMDFLVPMGTPPNAMAYGTGHVNVAQMARPGAVASLVGILLASSCAMWLW